MSSYENWELEVEQANQAFYRSFESLDIGRMESIWATDEFVKCIHPNWEACIGWSAVRDSWVRIFNNTAEIQFEIADVEIRIHGPVAWVICTEVVSAPVDGELQSSRMAATNLYLRKNDNWKLLHHHASPAMLRTRSPG